MPSLSPHQALQQYFGYDQFRPLQQEAIQSLIQGQDVFVLMPTGGGKSLCYAIPSLILDGLAIVVSPLISLMKDQVDNFQHNGLQAAFLNSSLSETDQSQVILEAEHGQLQLLYVAPERLLQPQFLSWLKQQKVSFFAIDEAHCISQWGHDFRPEYRQMAQLRDHFPTTPIMALTATATPRVKQDIINQLQLHQPQIYTASFFRPNLYYAVEPKQETRQSILAFIQQHPDQPGIIYCQSRNATEQLCQFLTDQGISSLPYHAGLTDEQRRTNQEQFKTDQVQVMVATVAFGMGIDKPNIRFVLHQSAPRSLEHYYQETGRAGRDGQPSQCLLYFSPGDLQMYRQFSQDLPPVEQRVALDKLDQVQRFAMSSDCRHRQLLEYFNDQSLDTACTSCDNCLTPPTLFDATTLAQQIFSCIYRLGRPYAPTYISNILTGKADDRITTNQHHQLSTFGIVANYSPPQLRQVMLELANQGYLIIDPAHYNNVSLTNTAIAVLKGQATIHLSDFYAPKAKKIKEAKAAKLKAALRQTTSSDAAIDQELFQILRQLRRQLADQANMPPYIIFPDTTLADLSAQKPTTLDQFAHIHGVGQKKLTQYGPQFIDKINQYLSDSSRQSG